MKKELINKILTLKNLPTRWQVGLLPKDLIYQVRNDLIRNFLEKIYNSNSIEEFELWLKRYENFINGEYKISYIADDYIDVNGDFDLIGSIIFGIADNGDVLEIEGISSINLRAYSGVEYTLKVIPDKILEDRIRVILSLHQDTLLDVEMLKECYHEYS